MSLAQVKVLAEYNQWMNNKLYDVCEKLPDRERKLDRGAFFKSIHGTLNHLLVADKVWLGRFENEPFIVDGLDQILFENFIELRQERQVTDHRINQWVASLTEDILNQPFHFKTIVNPINRTCTLWMAVTHFFNHQTHHRGQLTTLLNQCNADSGVTDLLYLPGLLEDSH